MNFSLKVSSHWFFSLQFKCFSNIGLRNLYAVTLSKKMAKFDGGKRTFILRMRNVFIQEHGMRKRSRVDLLSV